MADEDPVAELEERIAHRFKDRTLVRDALTHRSYANERPDLAPRDNERMEFLGDAIVDLAASALLWTHYPEAREGELSQRRADLVCERSLAAIARDASVGQCLRLGKGEEASGGRDKPRLLASALEAIVAAVYLDAGERDAITVARALLAPYIDAAAPGERDFKSRLQELVQADGRPPPSYLLVGTDGPDHDRTFHVEVRVGDDVLASGSGRSKLRAEQIAARAALRKLDDEDES